VGGFSGFEFLFGFLESISRKHEPLSARSRVRLVVMQGFADQGIVVAKEMRQERSHDTTNEVWAWLQNVTT
jgi:hypothetical protein